MLKPGVSIRLILHLSHSQYAGVAVMDISPEIFSSSQEGVAEPSSTRPSRGVAPEVYSKAETREVFPACEWPTTATLRRFALSYVFTRDSFQYRSMRI